MIYVTSILAFLFIVVRSSQQDCTILSNSEVKGSPVILYGSGCRCADFVPPAPPKCDCDNDHHGDHGGGGDNTPPPPPICPKDTGGEIWFVRHETDCHKYYECIDGKKGTAKKCNDGSNFDVDLELCDIEANVDCTGRNHYP